MIGIIGGSGLYELLDNPREEKVTTPYGEPSGTVSLGTIEGRDVAFLTRHGREHSVPPHLINYRANLRALRILSPGGCLITCSCSYHVDEAAFAQVIYEAAIDAGVHVGVVEKRMQGRDHPVLLGVPETYYLKCLIVRRIE